MYIFFKKILDKLFSFKMYLRKKNFYYSIRDYIFKKEIKKEKRIEKKGYDYMIKYIIKWYKKQTGDLLDLDNPKYLSEKQQWIKIYDQNPLKNTCSDKYEVREYVKKIIGSEYLIPLISINNQNYFFDANDINFDCLPNSFVIACNHGSSMTIVVKNKKSLTKKNIKQIQKKLNRWLKIEPAYINAFDFTYRNIKPCIFITKYLDNGDNDLYDYKFTCFNGKPQFVWVDTGRFSFHKRTIFDINFNRLDITINNYDYDDSIKKPKNYDIMIDLVEKLSRDFKYVRVDLYNVGGTIYFGELTFNSEAGIAKIYPRDADLLISKKLIL